MVTVEFRRLQKNFYRRNRVERKQKKQSRKRKKKKNKTKWASLEFKKEGSKSKDHKTEKASSFFDPNIYFF